MKITKKQLTPLISIVAVIAAFALLFATYSPARSNLGTDENFTVGEPAGVSLTEQLVEGEETAVFSAEGRTMYVTLGGVINVRDDETQEILWSNVAKETDVQLFGTSDASNSPVNITYRYDGETDTTFYSDTDAVQNNQYSVAYNEDNSRLQVTYLFGESGDGGLLPMALTKKFMEKEIFSKLEQEEIDFMLERYILYDKKSATSQLLEEFPGLNSNEIYYLELPGSFVIQTKIMSYLKKAGFTTAQYTQQCEITGEVATVYNENFMVTIEYWLDGQDVMINIPGESIYYHPEHPLTTITLNGASTYTTATENGAYLLPAGSGALQKFSESGERNNNYTYYGKDYLNTVSNAKENDFILPVYGVIREESNGLLAMIESGAEIAMLNERYTEGVGQLSLSLKLLEYGDASVTAQQTSTVYCSSEFKDDFTVRYRVMQPGADAFDMANQYRELLVKQKKLPETAVSSENMLVEIVGNIPYTYQWCGLFPVNKQVVLTDWEQAVNIAKDISESGVTPALKLSGFNEKGLYCQTPGNYKFIGSAKDRKNFLSYVEETGINTYLNVSMAYNYTRNSGLFSGYSAGSHSARAAGNDSAERLIVSKSTGESAVKSSVAQIVSPKMFEKYANKYNKKIDERFNISLGDAFSSLNTDYSENTPYNRHDTLSTILAATEILSENRKISGLTPSLPILANTAIAEDIVVVGEADYAISEYIPFVQAVLHGHVNYSSNSLNAYNDYELAKLEALSLGSTLKYTVVGSFDSDVMSTEYDVFYFTDWRNWKDIIIKDAIQTEKLYELIDNANIVDYTKDGDLTITEYSNGVKIYVNFSKEAIVLENVTIPARSATVA